MTTPYRYASIDPDADQPPDPKARLDTLIGDIDRHVAHLEDPDLILTGEDVYDARELLRSAGMILATAMRFAEKLQEQQDPPPPEPGPGAPPLH